MASVDRCASCGEIIPEGAQICPICKNKVAAEAKQNQANLTDLQKGEKHDQAIDRRFAVYLLEHSSDEKPRS